MNRSTAIASLIALLVLASGPARAAHLVGHPGATPMTNAEVRKVDLDARKITLKHGEIANLDMPAMTMVFRVADPAMLRDLKAGDQVRFSAAKVDGAFTVTAIEPGR